MSNLPVRQHVFNVAVVLRQNVLRNLLLGQPFEVLQVLLILSQVRLSGHDAALHEERLLAQDLCLRSGVHLWSAEIVNVVADWVESYHPGVHVDTCSLFDGSFGGLVSTVRKILGGMPDLGTHRTKTFLGLHRTAREFPVPLISLNKQIKRPLQQPVKALLIALLIGLRHSGCRLWDFLLLSRVLRSGIGDRLGIIHKCLHHILWFMLSGSN